MTDASKKTITTLFWITIAGLVLYVVLDAIAQILPPHYSPVSQAESDLAVGKYGFLMTLNFLNRGLLSLAFILAFLRSVDLVGQNRSRFKNGIYLMSVWAVGAILLAFFPTDVPATPISWHGAIHLVVALIAFICGAFGTLVISLKLDEKVTLQRGLRRIALPFAVIVVICWVIEFGVPFVVPHLNEKIGGLTETISRFSPPLDWRLFRVSRDAQSERAGPSEDMITPF